MKKKNAFRQGDVLIVPTKAVPKKAEKQGHLVLAEGEFSGHSHRIVEGKAELFKFNEKMYLKVLSKIAKITHEEHGLRTLDRGTYEIDIQQEWKEDGWTKVID